MRNKPRFFILVLCCFLTWPDKPIKAAQSSWSFQTKTVKTTRTEKTKKTRMPKKSKRTRRTCLKKTSTVWQTRINKQTKVRQKTILKKATVTAYRKDSQTKAITTSTKKTVTSYVYRKNPQKLPSLKDVAPRADASLLEAFASLGYRLQVDPSYSFWGHIDAASRTLKLKKADDTVYHELGHFLAFLSGNADQTTRFQGIYRKEKDRYKGYDKSYVLQNSQEYFAQSYKEYVLNQSKLMRERPRTYQAIQKALMGITEDRLRRLQAFYQIFGQ